MIRICAVVALLGGGVGFSPPLGAQEQSPQPPQPPQPPGAGDPGFAFYRSDDSYLRLDLHTGEVVACARKADDWLCSPVPDERAALGSEITRLRRENALLKNALLAGGVALPAGLAQAGPPSSVPTAAESAPVAPRAAAAPPSPAQPAPATESERAAREDAEIERVMTVMEKVWRRLVNMMINIQREMQKRS